MKYLSKISLFILFFIGYSSIPQMVFSQKKKTVALVLSGGGAKGLAHIGVLKYLEENEIPIDYILGTSMGAIVGAMYSGGYSPKEIETLVLQPKFQDWVLGKIPRRHSYFYTQSTANPSWLKLDLSLGENLKSKIAPRLLKDISLNFTLAELTAQASQACEYDFDQLMIPFAAMASDIFTQKEIVIRKGTLNNAMRTSMTVPFVYRPVKINGRYYFDGGVYNNFPVDVCRKIYKPDIIIGINLSAKTFREYPEEIDDELIANALAYSVLDNSVPELLKDQDVYIEPNLKAYSALDFTKVKALIDSGYVATERKLAELNEKIIEKRDSVSLAKKRNDFLNKKEEFKFSGVRKIGYNTDEKHFIDNIFRKRKKKTYSSEEIKSNFYKLVSHKYFQNTYPNIVWNSQKKNYELELTSEKNNYFTINAGGNLSYGVSSTLFLGLEVSHFNKVLMQHELNFYTGRFYHSIYENSNIYLPSLNKYSLGVGAVINTWDYIQTNSFLEATDSTSLLRQNDQSINLSLERSLGTHSKLKIYSNYIWQSSDYADTKTYHLKDTLDQLKQYGIKLGVEISSNTLNSNMFPSKGLKFRLRLNYLDLHNSFISGNSVSQENSEKTSRWLNLGLKMEEYFRLTRNYSIGYLVQGAISGLEPIGNYYGTLINTPAFYPYEDSKFQFQRNYRAPIYLAGGIKNVFSSNNSKLQLRLDAFLYSPIKEILEKTVDGENFRFNSLDKYSLLGGATLVYQLPIGPLSFNYRYYDEGQSFNKFFITFGYYFFNNKSTE